MSQFNNPRFTISGKSQDDDAPIEPDSGVDPGGINVLALIKGPERYIFLYGDDYRVETLRTLGRFAADPELSFSWYDASILSKKIREMDSYWRNTDEPE